MPDETNQGGAEAQPESNNGNEETAAPASTHPPRKLFPMYGAAGDEGGLTQKGLGIFILCATAAVAAFFIYLSLR